MKKTNTTPVTKKLYRSVSDKVIAGIAGGLADYLNIDSTLIRIAFILLTLFGGAGPVIYIILWIIIPTQNSKFVEFEDVVRQNAQELKTKANQLGRQFSKDNDKGKIFLASFVIFVGLIFLFQNFGFLNFFDWGKLWPLFLIAFGVGILFTSKRQ